MFKFLIVLNSIFGEGLVMVGVEGNKLELRSAMTTQKASHDEP